MHLKMFLLALTLANLYTSANCLPNLNTVVKLNSLQCFSDVTTGKTTDKPTVTCDAPGAQMIGGQCLYFSTGWKNWEDAVTACADMEGELAQSLLDPQAVVDYAKNNGRWYGWVGATDANKKGTWRWHDGTLMESNFPWASGYPAGNSNDNCLYVTRQGYFDVACTDKHRYICDLGGASAQNIRTEVKAPAENLEGVNRCKVIPVTCDAPGAQMIGGQCLFFSTDADGRKTWNVSVTACADMGGELAQSLLDPQAVLDYTKTTDLYPSYWVGATDAAEEGTWRWLDGTLMDTNFPWGPGEPSVSSRYNCLYVNEYGYYDSECADQDRYICELGGAPSQVIRTEVKTPAENNKISNTKCVSPWIYVGHSTGCLLHIQQSMDWHSAQAYCNSMDGDLPMLDIESKHIDMMDYFQRSGLENVSFWLGANDNSGSLLWVNGMPVRDGWKYTQSKVDQGEDLCLYTYLLGQNGDPPLINYCSHLLHNIICQKRVM